MIFIFGVLLVVGLFYHCSALSKLELERDHYVASTKTLYSALSAVHSRVRKGEKDVLTDAELESLHPDNLYPTI